MLRLDLVIKLNAVSIVAREVCNQCHWHIIPWCKDDDWYVNYNSGSYRSLNTKMRIIYRISQSYTFFAREAEGSAAGKSDSMRSSAHASIDRHELQPWSSVLFPLEPLSTLTPKRGAPGVPGVCGADGISSQSVILHTKQNYSYTFLAEKDGLENQRRARLDFFLRFYGFMIEPWCFFSFFGFFFSFSLTVTDRIYMLQRFL